VQGAWNDWLIGVPVSKTNDLFTGQPGHTYSFHCRATGSDGSSGGYPATADASTTITASALPAAGSPNLAVLSLAAFPHPSGGVLVQAAVQNQGTLGTQNGFYTDLYLNHLPAGPRDYTGSLRYWVNAPLPAGAMVTLTAVITDLSDANGASPQNVGAIREASGTLYAQADSTGVVSQTNRAKDIYATGVPVCVASPDAYEPDDSAGMARSIGVGQAVSHNLTPGDHDWARFDAQGGVTYTIFTANLGPSADTSLYLYSADGATLLASNDDQGGSLASRIDWQAPATGTYSIMVQNWNPNAGACGTSYTLWVTHGLTGRAYLPVLQRAP
jgi:hypothetical protein